MSGPPFEPLPAAAWSVPCDRTAPREFVPNHDKSEVVDPPYAGAPLGGLGAGTVTRSHRGDFVRWHLAPGVHRYHRLPACAQAIAVHRDDDTRACIDAFALGTPPDDGTLGTWSFRHAGFRYAALYPRSWFDGTAAGGRIRWRLTQLSPVLPGNYVETSYPVGVFRVTFRNDGDDAMIVSFLTSWENLAPPSPGVATGGRPTHAVAPEDGILWLGRASEDPNDSGAVAMAVTGGDAFAIADFPADGDGHAVWSGLTGVGPDREPGHREPGGDTTDHRPGGVRRAGAIGARIRLAPGERRDVTCAIAWHFPVMRFGAGRAWYRRHTAFVGRHVGGGPSDPTDPAVRLAREALTSATTWMTAIAAWQRPYLERRSPELTRALFNTLYILADGGTIWQSGPEATEHAGDGAPAGAAPAVPGCRDVGRFAVLECFTYPYYATLDVRYYGSLPLLFFWPELERQVLLQFAQAALAEDVETRDMVHVEERAVRKRRGTLPHDLGRADEDPWVKINAYDDIDPNRWKDLGSKFVLLIVRYMGRVRWEDRGFLRAVWPAVEAAMAHLASQDRDGDGLPDNEGIPDQTFDKWPMTGLSAYCGGLALAALRAAETLAEWCGRPGQAREYERWRRRATGRFVSALWRGDHLAYDAAPENAEMVMCGQLSGDWACALAGFPTVLSETQTRDTLDTIWRSCRAERNGVLWGLHNGAAYVAPDGQRVGPAPDNRHAKEIWSGINYAVVSQLVLAGLDDPAARLVEALDRVIGVDCPFAFGVPEAWEPDGRFRGALYVRPLAVWAVEEALRRRRPDDGAPPFLVGPEASG